MPNPNNLLPARALSVGVTGHRPERLAGMDMVALDTAVRHVLAVIAESAGPSAHLRLVSALAEGADSIVADAALATAWPLDVVLPFRRTDYATDFESGEVHEAHVARLAQARAVFELPGDRSEAGAAYERTGRVVLTQSDLLVAVWDGGPVRGRGGAPQIVAEAVLAGIPVVQIDPAKPHAPLLLWSRLGDVDLGLQDVHTVPRGDLGSLPDLVRTLIDAPEADSETAMITRFQNDPVPTGVFGGLAYPMLLRIMGVEGARDRRTKARPETTGSVALLRFARADDAATRLAQRFRSSYVSNFTLAALAVVLSLLGLVLPANVKPVLILLELAAIGTILITTRVGVRGGLHRRWLDYRALAERLRCLSLSARLGDLDLRGDPDKAPGWVAWYTRATARELGLPSVHVDDAYLSEVQTDLAQLVDGQIEYLTKEAGRMHRLEHRLHLIGTILFSATAVTCLLLLIYKASHDMMPAFDALQLPITTLATIIGAALPAIGAAIYGIRMQGDFAGIAERNEALAHQLSALRRVIAEDANDFDTLNRRVRRTADLLTGDLAAWLHTYHARPLALPG